MCYDQLILLAAFVPQRSSVIRLFSGTGQSYRNDGNSALCGAPHKAEEQVDSQQGRTAGI
jgi:hypothetical protein